MEREEEANKVIKDLILCDIRNLLEHKEEENYYKPVEASNFRSNYYYIECESNGDRNKHYQLKNILIE